VTQEIYEKMLESYKVDFTYFREIKIVKQPELLKRLANRMREDLKNNGITYSDTQWQQIFEKLLENRIKGFFENFAFYNPKDETLYMNEEMIANYPKKILSTCAHELAEKLLSAYVSPSAETRIQALMKKCLEAKRTGNTRRFYEFLDAYTDTVLRNVFREGYCEAIALKTLRHMSYESETASLENELMTEWSKTIKLIFTIENKRIWGRARSLRLRMQSERHGASEAIDEASFMRDIFVSSQVIKGLSYCLGYPLAKVVLEKYGIDGAKIVLAGKVRLQARYFADPQEFLIALERPQAVED
jgi:hypothetical protein